jgi:integrase
MKPQYKKLRAIEALPAGTHRIGPRLYVRREDIGDGTTKRTVLVRWHDGRAKVKSLGAWQRGNYGHYLAEAQRVSEARKMGRDVRVTLEEGAPPDTFRAACEEYMQLNLPALSAAKDRAQWRYMMERLAYPVIGDLKINQIEIGHIAKMLEPHWLRVPPRARLLRRRTEQVLAFAISRGNLNISNVASLDFVRHRLPRQPKRVIVPRKSLPHAQVPACFERLGQDWLSSSEALRFVIVTAARSSEVRLMRWSEIDFTEKVWTCPASRMKMGKDWRVPLSRQALDLLRRMQDLRRGGSPFVFPGGKPGQPLSHNVMQDSMRRSGFEGDQHGFRSSFKQWCQDHQRFNWEAVEMCLAHDVQGGIERIYGRSDLLHLRAPIMQQWSDFVTRSGKIARFPQARHRLKKAA